MLQPEKRTDHQITKAVIDDLNLDPAIKILELNVRTKAGKVTLSGTCDTHTTKRAATLAAYRVARVVEVENNIIVNPVFFDIVNDQDIAASVLKALELDSSIPSEKIMVEVLNGVVTLYGTIDYDFQKKATEDTAARIGGVRGIRNLITVEYTASAEDIGHRIEEAFARNAVLYDDNIKVKVEGNKVILAGTVETQAQRRMAEKVAGMAPGVSEIKNFIFVMEPFSD